MSVPRGTGTAVAGVAKATQWRRCPAPEPVLLAGLCRRLLGEPLHLVPAARVLPSQGPEGSCSPRGPPRAPTAQGRQWAETCRIVNLPPAPGSCFRQL